LIHGVKITQLVYYDQYVCFSKGRTVITPCGRVVVRKTVEMLKKII